MSLKQALISILVLVAWSSVSAAQGQAPGNPIFDCAGDAATINRLVAGLPGQEATLKRAEAALDAAREDAQHDSAEAREKWLEATIKMLASQASGIADSSQKLLAREEGLKAAGISANAAARFKFLEKVKQIHELGEKLEHASNAYQAGNAYGNSALVQQTARELTAQIGEAGKLLVDSGIAEEVGGKLALALWGPIGEAGFNGINTGLDLLAGSLQAAFSAADADQAARNLEVLRSQYQRSQDRIYELQQEVAENCPNPVAKPTTPPPATPPPPAHALVNNSGSGSHTGLILLVGGVGAAGAVAYAAGVAMKNQANSSGGGAVSGHCDGMAPSNACGACTCTPNVNCSSSSQCGGDDCWTSSATPPFC